MTGEFSFHLFDLVTPGTRCTDLAGSAGYVNGKKQVVPATSCR